MHAVPFEITKPSNEDAFEDMCARIYGDVFSDWTPTKNGRRGQAQAGIDVFVDGPDGRIGIQCKKYADKALLLKHVVQEVGRADSAAAPILMLIVATTAASDAVLLRAVHDLSDARVAAGKFAVKIEFWPDLCRHIESSGALQNHYAPNAPGAMFHRIDEHNAELRSQLVDVNHRLEMLASAPAGRADSVNKFLSAQLDAVGTVITENRFKDAFEDIQRIGVDMSPFDDHQRARWHVQRGICTWHLVSGRDAASDFLRGFELYPADEKIAAANVRGLLFLDRVDDALVAASDAVARFPASVHAWLAFANARMVKELPVELADVPASFRENCDVLQMLAWSQKNHGTLRRAVELSAKAAEQPDAGFFVRSTALVFALEAASTDPVKASHGLLSDGQEKALSAAVERMDPRDKRLWLVQSPGSVDDAVVHLGFGYLVLGKPEQALQLVEEAKHAKALTPRVKRVALEAHRKLEQAEVVVRLGREWLDDIELEGLVAVAESASNLGDVALLEAICQRVWKGGPQTAEFAGLFAAMRWVAMWHSGTHRDAVLVEARATDFGQVESIPVVTAAARLLSASNDEVNAGRAADRALELVGQHTSTADRMSVADMFFYAKRFVEAAKQYEFLAKPGQHSEVHNRLLRCYVRSNAIRKAKDLVLSFPPDWTNDERALSLAIDMGQQAADWEFLNPLAKLHCERYPNEVGGWALSLALAAKMQKKARFQVILDAVPAKLTGPTRFIAQIASMELRFGKKEDGLRRLYRLYRSNLDDANVASAYFVALVAGPQALPFMADGYLDVEAGCTVTLSTVAGDTVVQTIDPTEIDALPARAGFLDATSALGLALIGKNVGDSVEVLGPFTEPQTFMIQAITSAYRQLLQLAQEIVKTPGGANLPVMSVPIPTTEDGMDFSHMHAMLKRQAQHARRAMEAYKDSPITLSILARLLGKNVIDVVQGWPQDAPPLFVVGGTVAQREEASALLAEAGGRFVVDAVTVAELGSLDCLESLSALPQLFISTTSVEVLHARLEEAKLDRPGGCLYDDNGSMRLTEYSDADRQRQIARFQAMVDAVEKYCVVQPAYGPDVMPGELAKAHEVLEREELSALLLAAELNATLLSVDGRLTQFAFLQANIRFVWPQALLMFFVGKGLIEPEKYSLAVVRMFLWHRSFVSMGPRDLAVMCLQGGYALREGLQELKRYLSSPGTELRSGMHIAFEFLEMQVNNPTQLKAFMELVTHLIEALLRHPHAPRDDIVMAAHALMHKVAKNIRDEEIPYKAVQGYLDAKQRACLMSLNAAVRAAIRNADAVEQRRPVRLRSLRGPRVPHLIYDGDAEAENHRTPTVQAEVREEQPIGEAARGAEPAQSFLIASDPQ